MYVRDGLTILLQSSKTLKGILSNPGAFCTVYDGAHNDLQQLDSFDANLILSKHKLDSFVANLNSQKRKLHSFDANLNVQKRKLDSFDANLNSQN